MDPQHWLELEHAALASAQQMVLLGDGRHEAPAQHCEAAVHEAVSARQVGATAHTPPEQVSPASQLAPPQHD